MSSEPHDTPDRYPTNGDPADSPAEEAFATYVAERESGTLPDLESYLGELDAADRAAFQALLDELQDTEATLDGPVRPGVILDDRLEIQHELGDGQGGMGKVFAAFDRKLERRVAVKVLRDHTGGALDGEGQLRAEALALAKLNHPNIVTVHDVLHLADATCLVMDEVKGVALADVIDIVRRRCKEARDRPRRAKLIKEAVGLLPSDGHVALLRDDARWADAVANIALVVCRALEAAHGAGVLHRDLKPRNVMLRGGGSPVVLDFGLAHAQTSGRAEPRGRLRGSAAYLAPEQIAREQLGDDPRTDVYQVGLLLYEMLTLRPAFTGKQLSTVLRRIVRGELRQPRALDPSIPYELEAICLKAMERHPDRRYATVAELAADLERFVTGSVLPHAARGGVVRSSLRTARYALRRRRTAVAAACVALVAGLAAAWFLRPDPGPDAPERIAWYAVDDVTKEPTLRPTQVSPLDVMGFAISCDSPRWLYVLSVFGSETDPPTWVAPMPAVPPGADPLAPRAHWGLQVEAGVTNVNCAEASEARPDIPYEGLWVYVGRERNNELEAWMAELSILAEEAYDRGSDYAVSYEDARAAFERVKATSDPVGTRGGPITMTAEELAEVERSLDAAALLDDDWPYDEPRRYTTFMRLRP